MGKVVRLCFDANVCKANTLVVLVLSCFPMYLSAQVSDKPIIFSKKEGSVEFFMKEITERTNYTFSYINNEIPVAKIVVLKSSQQTLKQILDILSETVGIAYTIKGTKIIFSSRKKSSSHSIINGVVKDKASGELLAGATILVRELSMGAVSNAYGFYSFTLPAGSYMLSCSYVGYKSSDIPVELSESIQLNFELSINEEVLDEIEVDAERGNENITATTMSVIKPDLQVMKKMPAFLGEVDIIRSLVQLPGVTTVGEAAPGFNVRGGGIDQNLVLLDEAPVYNTSHLFGFYSVFNPDAVKGITLYKGGIPANYGGRLSSVLDITQREGNNKKFQGSGGIGLVASRLLLEGPLVKNKSSFMLAARRSYADLFLKHLKSANLDQAFFYDINTKINYSFDAKNKVYLSGYFGKDRYRLGDDVDIDWGNINATARWNHLFSEKLFSNFTAVYSDYQYSQGEPTGIYAYKGERAIKTYTLKSDFSWYQSLNHTVNFGMSSLYYEFNPGKIKPVDISLLNSVVIPKEYARESALYISDEYKITPRLSTTVGLRYSFFQERGPGEVFIYDASRPRSALTITDTVSYDNGKTIKGYHGLEPRVALAFKLDEHHSLKASYNRTFQYIHFISNTTTATPIDFWKSSDPYLKPEMADQWALGYFRNFNDNLFQVSVESYYKQIENLVDYKNGADLLLNPALDAELLQGKGRAYGIELLVNKTQGRLTGWTGYSFSRTERVINGPTPQEKINKGQYYPANYDQPHKLNVVAAYEYNKRWSFSANFTYQTGRPVTYPDGGYRFHGMFLPYYESRNQARLPDYHRLDLAATLQSKQKPGRKWEGSWTFSLYNVYARKNAYSIYFRNKMRAGTAASRETEAVQLSILGSIFPSITYNFKF